MSQCESIIMIFSVYLCLLHLDLIVQKDIKHFTFYSFGNGRLAQLVEHLVYTEGVKGSSPLLPTKKIYGGVAQLVRAIACHAIGRGFESRHSRHNDNYYQLTKSYSK